MRGIRFAAVLCCAVVFGLTLSHVLQSPGSFALDGADWLQIQQTFYGGFAVVGGVAEVVGVVSAAALAVRSRRSHRQQAIAALIAVVCLLGTLTAFFVGNLPVNTHVAGWTAATLPEDWFRYRQQWETAHAVSAALSGLALVVLLTALTASAHAPARKEL